MLQPWLIVNTLVRYKGKQSKEEMISIGLNLINGVMILDMMEQLNGIALDQSISDQCFTISPLIKIESGYS